MGGTVGKNDALRIGKGIKNIERITLKNTAGLSKPVKIKTGIPAKITKVGEEGFYDLIEQMPVEDGAGFEDKKPKARVWAEEPTQDEPDPLPQAFEINSNEDLEEDLIVYIYRLSNNESIQNQWFFDSGSGGADGSGPKTDKSNTTVKGKIQFRNDITFERQGDASFIVNINDLGDVTNGCVAYGGNEQADGSEEGFQRHYKFIFDVKSPQAGYLIPQTDAGIVSDADTLNNLNDLWIGFKHRFGGQTMEIFHNVLESSLRSDTNFKFPSTPAGGTLGRFFVSATTGGTVNVPVDVDRTGHILSIDGNDSTIITPPDETNISQVAGGAPSSGTLYNVPITQTTNLTTLAGVDTNTLNGANALIYEADTPAGAPIDIGFTTSVHVSFFADATEYNGAGTGGNDTDIKFHLAKTLDGKDISLRGFLDENKLNDTDTVTDIDSVELTCTYQTIPVPIDTSFDVRVTLIAGPNGVGNPGDRFIRFDNDGEYDVTVYLIYEADKADFDATNAQTFVATNTETVASFAGNTLSGADVSFTFDFPDNKTGSNLIARAFLEFERTAANPQPLAGQTGTCTISNNGSLCDDVEAIAGNPAIGTMDVANSTYSPDGTPGTTINGVDFTQLDNPIVCTYTILKNGNPTTEFSLDAVTSNFQVFSGTNEVRVSTNNFEFDNSAVLITNPINGTDGYIFTINFMETAFVADGQEYLVKETTVGVSNSPQTDTFSFGSEGSIFPATDFFGTNSQDLPFQMSDAFTGVGQNSDTFNAGIFTERFQNISDTAGASIQGGAIKVTITASGTGWGMQQINPAMSGPFEISVTFANVNLAASGILRSPNFNVVIDGETIFIIRALNENGAVNGYYWERSSVGVLGFIANQPDTMNELTIKRNSSGLVEIQIGGVTQSGGSFTKTGDLTQIQFSVDALPGSNPTTFTADITNYRIELGNTEGSVIPYFQANRDRWSESLIGEAYQLVNTSTNELEQIHPAFGGQSIMALINQFAGGTNPDIATSTWKVDLAIDNITFDGTATEQQFLEVINLASADMRMGYRHNGTEQQLFAFDGTSDLFSEFSSVSSNTVTIERGDFSLSDSWSGTGQDSTIIDDGIYKARWPGPSGANSIGAQVIAGSISATSTTVNESWGVEQITGLSISGDFEITYTFSGFSSVPGASGVRGALIEITIGGTIYDIVRDIGEVSTDGYYFQIPGLSSIEQPDSANTMTFKRTGNTLDLKVGGTTHASATVSGNLTRIFGQMNTLGSAPTSYASKCDSITVKLGSEDITVERVLFKENETLKAAFNDGGSNVNNINIVSDSTLAVAYNCQFQSINVEAPTGTQFTFDPEL